MDEGDGILMLGVQGGFNGVGTLVDLVLEDIHGRRTLADSSLASSSGIKLFDKLPAALVGEQGWVAVVSSGNDVGVTGPGQRDKRQLVPSDSGDNRLSRAHVADTNGRVLSTPGKGVSRWVPFDGLTPSTNVELKSNFSKVLWRSKASGFRLLLVDSLDGGVEDSDLVVGGSGSAQGITRMPVKIGDGGFMSLDMFGDPPIVILFKIADSNDLSSSGHSEFVFLRTPLHMSGASVDSQDHKNWLPFSLIESPHIGISILGARNNSVGFFSPINSSHNFVMIVKGMFKLEAGTRFLVNLDCVVIWANSNSASVRRPSVASDGSSKSVKVSHFE